MVNSNKRKLSIGLLIAGFALIAGTFVLFLASHAFYIRFAETGGCSASLFVLGFGGGWKLVLEPSITLNYPGNAFLAIAGIFLTIALILSIILIYSFISKKFLPKTNFILALVIVGLMLYVACVTCATKVIAVNTYSKQYPGIAREIIAKGTTLNGSTIAAIVLSFVSLACFTAFSLLPYTKKKA